MLLAKGETTMNTNGNSDKLQREMSSIRRNLGEHTEQIIEDAREQLNWHHYVTNYPWIALGAAAAAGYFLVPSRCRCNAPSQTTPAVNAAAQPAHFQPAQNHPTSTSSPVTSAVVGVLGSVLAMVATTVAREGFATVSKMASEWWASAQNQPTNESANAPRERREPQL